MVLNILMKAYLYVKLSDRTRLHWDSPECGFDLFVVDALYSIWLLWMYVVLVVLDLIWFSVLNALTNVCKLYMVHSRINLSRLHKQTIWTYIYIYMFTIHIYIYIHIHEWTERTTECAYRYVWTAGRNTRGEEERANSNTTLQKKDEAFSVSEQWKNSDTT